MKLALIALAVFIINVPFGYWRAHTRKFSAQWILAIHLPVPLVVAIRIYSGLGFELTSFPIMIGSYFLGQYVGGRAYSYIERSRGRHAAESAANTS